jgi:hypothetical protein
MAESDRIGSIGYFSLEVLFLCGRFVDPIRGSKSLFHPGGGQTVFFQNLKI